MPVPVNPHIVSSQGGYSRDGSMEVYARMSAQSAVTVNDHLLAQQILGRGGVPVVREGAPGDDDLDGRGVDPVAYADALHNQLLQIERNIPGAELTSEAYLGNEIGTSTPQRTGAWFNAAIRRLNFHRRPVCAFNFAVRNPPDNAEGAKFIREAFPLFIDALRFNPLSKLGFHEGTYVDPNTGEVVDTLAKAIQAGAIGGYRRFMREFGVKCRITEFAASKTPVDGWSTWMSEEEYAKLINNAVAQVYAPDEVEIHPYTVWKWDRAEGFEYRNALKLQLSFAATNAAYPYKGVKMANYLEFNYGKFTHHAKVSASAPIRLRLEPSTTGLILGTVKAGDEVAKWDIPFKSGAYDWYRVVLGDVLGFVASTAGLKFTDVGETSSGGSEGLSAEQAAELEAIYDDLGAFIEEVVPAQNVVTF
mgnify:CR=1 FL=1